MYGSTSRWRQPLSRPLTRWISTLTIRRLLQYLHYRPFPDSFCGYRSILWENLRRNTTSTNQKTFNYGMVFGFALPTVSFEEFTMRTIFNCLSQSQIIQVKLVTTAVLPQRRWYPKSFSGVPCLRAFVSLVNLEFIAYPLRGAILSLTIFVPLFKAQNEMTSFISTKVHWDVASPMINSS